MKGQPNVEAIVRKIQPTCVCDVTRENKEIMRKNLWRLNDKKDKKRCKVTDRHRLTEAAVLGKVFAY